MTEERISEIRAYLDDVNASDDEINKKSFNFLSEMLEEIEKEQAISQRLAKFLYDDAKVCANVLLKRNSGELCEEKLGTDKCVECWRMAAEKDIQSKENDVSDENNALEFNKLMFFSGLAISVRNGVSLEDWLISVHQLLTSLDCGEISLNDIDSFCKEWNINTDCVFILFDEYLNVKPIKKRKEV